MSDMLHLQYENLINFLTSLFSTNDQGVKVTTHLHLVPRLRMHEATLPLPHTSSWQST